MTSLKIIIIYVYKKNYTENPDIDLTIDGEIVERNGKNHLTIQNVNSHIELTNLHIDMKCKNLWGFINRKVNDVSNANWQLLKADLDPTLQIYVNTIIREILVPMLDEISMQDMFEE